MAYIEESIEIAAPPEAVWRVLVDVERWPEWTESMTSVRRLDAGPLAVGSEARVKQPGLRAATMTVTQINDGQSFTWETRPLPTVTVSAVHAIERIDAGSRVTLSIRSTGLLAPLLSPMLVRVSKRFVPMEARGLKHRVESGAQA
jgi:uncharacterized protein YndB with AHSA1/START domain